MNPINLLIAYADGSTREVSATAADLIAFESHFNMSIAQLGKDPRLTYMFYLAWHADKRSGHTELPFEEWTELVTIVTEAEVKK